MKNIITTTIILILISFLFGNCNYLSKKRNLKGLYGRIFCLDVKRTSEVNSISIGNGTMTLNDDMTFSVTNDSLRYSNIKGVWDICCYDSDYGNYIFKVNEMKERKTSTPEFYVKIDGIETKLIFTTCN